MIQNQLGDWPTENSTKVYIQADGLFPIQYKRALIPESSKTKVIILDQNQNPYKQFVDT